MAVDVSHRRQFLAHRRQRGMVRIVRVVAGLEHDGAVRREAGEGVDVRVGVVALQFAGLMDIMTDDEVMAVDVRMKRR